MSIKQFNILWIFLIIFMYGCVTPPPRDDNNICNIFKQYPHWYWAAQATEERWKVPIHVQMAVIRQESRYNGSARPPRTKLLGFIPWVRPSSAYGYCQALKETWMVYKNSSGVRGVDRDNFGDSLDFIGWYGDQVRKKLGIHPTDVYNLYLAYHEGVGGYQRNTHLNKIWLKEIAAKVHIQAALYKNQLLVCQNQLKNKPWYVFW